MNLESIRNHMMIIKGRLPITVQSGKPMRPGTVPIGRNCLSARIASLIRVGTSRARLAATAILLAAGCACPLWGTASAMAASPESPAISAPVEIPAPLVVMHTGTTSPICLAMDVHGALYLADEQAGTVRCVTRDGETATLVSGLTAPCAVAVDHKRQLVIGTRTGELWRILPNGEAHQLARGLPPVLSVTIDRDGAALAATATGELFRLGGN